MKIYLPVICYNHTVLSHYMFSIMRLIFEGQKKNISFSLDCIYFDSLIARARNAAAANFVNKMDCDYMMFIDTDISFEPKSFFSLISRNKDVISGLYPKKYINAEKLSKLVLLNGPILPDNYNQLCTDFATEINLKKEPQQVEEVNYAATGFMLIKKKALLDIIKKRPDISYKNDIDGYASYGDTFYDLFPCKINTQTKKYEAEDYGFCDLYRSVGGKLYVDTTCELTHYGWKGYEGNYHQQSIIFNREPSYLPTRK